MTRKNIIPTTVLLTAAMLAFTGCDSGSTTVPEPAPGPWALTEVKTLEGFDVPECVLVDPAGGRAWVSNIETSEEGYWTADGKGFLSTLSLDGEVLELRQATQVADVPLEAPKGMCLLNGSLLVADITHGLVHAEGGTSGVIDIPGGTKCNDMAADGKYAYVTDTAQGKLFRIDPSGSDKPSEWKLSEIPAPEGINGVTCAGGKIFAVSWDLHEVYELDPAGKKPPVAFGLAEHFKNLDGIEVLDDGTFIVSDFVGKKVCSITPDRKTVTVLAELESPADIGLDRKRMLLYVPQFLKGKVVVYKLAKG